jgi:hypothetical protein
MRENMIVKDGKISERKRGVSVHVPGKEKHMRNVDRPALCGY